MATLTVGEIQVDMNTWEPFPFTNGVIVQSPVTTTKFEFWNGAFYRVLGSGFSWYYPAPGQIVFTGGTVTTIQPYQDYDNVEHIQFTISNVNQPLLTLINLAQQDVSQFNTTVFAGNDSLTGGIGYDNLYGFAGNDTMHGG